MVPCPPAETAEINQYDLADALIDTEKSSNRDESLDPGTTFFPTCACQQDRPVFPFVKK